MNKQTWLSVYRTQIEEVILDERDKFVGKSDRDASMDIDSIIETEWKKFCSKDTTVHETAVLKVDGEEMEIPSLGK
jgi:hypothetical protein